MHAGDFQRRLLLLLLLSHSQVPSHYVLKSVCYNAKPLTLYSTWVFFFFLVSFLWFWVSLSSFLLLSPLLEPSLLFFFVVCQVPAGGRSCNTTQKKKKKTGKT